MLWLLAALLMGYALFLPCTLTIRVHHHERTQTRLTFHFAGLHKTWTFSGMPSASSPLQKRMGQQLLSALRGSEQARSFLKRRTHLIRLDALLLLRTGDAARTALLTGFLRSAACMLPQRQVRICAQPDFFRPHSTVDVRCIIRWKMGTLLLTAWMLLAESLRRQPLTESEAT